MWNFLERYFMSEYAGYALLGLALASSYGSIFLPVIVATWLLIPSKPMNDDDKRGNE